MVPTKIKRLLLTILLVIGVSWQHCFSEPRLPPAPHRSELNSELRDAAIKQLDSDLFQEREEAQKTLSQGGLDTVTAIVPQLPDASLEQRVRLMQVVESIYESALLHQENEQIVGIQQLLPQIRMIDEAHLGTRIDNFEITHYRLLINASIRRLITLNAGIDFRRSTFNIPGISKIQIDTDLPENIYLGKDFVGTEEDFPHLLRALSLGAVQFGRSRGLFHIGNCPIPFEALEDLQAGLGNVAISHRGPARIGIGTDRDSFGRGMLDWRITTVTPRSSAKYAGLQIYDRIVRLNDEPVGSFNSFVEDLQEYEPGQVIELDVLRNETVSEDFELVVDENGKTGITIDKEFLRFRLIKAVEKGSPAEKAGLSKMYQIDRFDGKSVDDNGVDYYSLYLSTKKPGDKIVLSCKKLTHMQVELRGWVGPYR